MTRARVLVALAWSCLPAWGCDAEPAPLGRQVAGGSAACVSGDCAPLPGAGGQPLAGAAAGATGGAGVAGPGATPTSGVGGAGQPVSGAPAGNGAGGGVGVDPPSAGGAASGGAYGGYIEGGGFAGYAWTAATGGGSIEPADFASQTDFPLCARGGVAEGTSHVAMVGWNVNQAVDDGAPALAVTPSLGGFHVRVQNPGGSALRLQVQGPNGGSDPDDRWCAPIGDDSFVAHGDLNTECWAGGVGNAYAGEPIVAVMVLVPGAEASSVSFDFCIELIEEAEVSAPVAGSGGRGGTGGGGSVDYPPIVDGCNGYATRYWDCCKPHCGWSGNVPGGVQPLTSCGSGGQSYGANYDVGNACTGGGAYTCYSMAPWAAGSQLAYGFAAVPATADVCGRCYQLEFTGSSHNAGGDPGSAALAGKTMIVQATNVGGDVGGGQFDLLVPGGGVGAFDACSGQWGASGSELGERYGGLLSTCKQIHGSNHAAVKGCVSDRCQSLFSARGLTELAAGCEWFVGWFEAADNPNLKYQEVTCPPELRGVGVDRTAQPAGGCGI